MGEIKEIHICDENGVVVFHGHLSDEDIIKLKNFADKLVGEFSY